jgi:hypothetical protein
VSPSKLPSGTRIAEAIGAGYHHYTVEQLAALEGMKDRAYTFGIARAEFANTVLQPDGSHSTDLAAVTAAAKAQLNTALSGDTDNPAVLDQAKRLAELAQQIRYHIKQNRFLFVVGDDHLPIIYFPCATPDNVDALSALSPHADDHPVLVADHPDPTAHTAYAAEVADKIAKVIATARAAAKRES